MEREAISPAIEKLPSLRVFMSPSELDYLNLLTIPLWIFDLDLGVMWWANQAALQVWGSASLQELASRDFVSGMSAQTRDRLAKIRAGLLDQRIYDEFWIFQPVGDPLSAPCRWVGVLLEGSRVGVLVQANSTNAYDRDTLLGFEGSRTTSVLVSIYDEQAALSYRNPAAAQAYGDTAQTLLSQVLIPLNDVDIEHGLATDGEYRFEARVQTLLGERWHDIELRRTRSSLTGQVSYVVCERDVTERRCAQLALLLAHQSTEQLASERTAELREALLIQDILVDNALIAIAWTRDFNLVRANKRFYQMFGLEDGEMVGESLSALYMSDSAYQSAILLADEHRAHGDELVLNQWMRHKSGKPIFIIAVGREKVLGDPAAGMIWLALDVTRSRKAEQRLEAALSMKERMFGTLPVGICSTRNSRIIECNALFGQMVGTPHEKLIGRSINDCGITLNFSAMHREVYSALNDNRQSRREQQLLRADGSSLWVVATARLIDPSDIKQGTLWSLEDIDARKRAEQALSETAKIQQLIFENVSTGLCTTQADRVISCNRRFEEIFDARPGECVGLSVDEAFRSQKEFLAVAKQMVRTLVNGEAFSVEIELVQRSGGLIWARLTGRMIDADQPALGNVWIVEDITEQRAAQNALRRRQEDLERMVSERTVELQNTVAHLHREMLAREMDQARNREMALQDPLTHLANRMALRDSLAAAIDGVNEMQLLVAVVFVDLDHFKTINDSLGHQVGDDILRVVAQRLQNTMRMGDLVARLGGDEFVLVLNGLAGQDELYPLLERVLASIRQPMNIGTKQIVMTLSMGVSLFPSHGDDVDTLLKHADIAMYEAKARGRNTFQVFDAQLTSRVERRMAIEQRLRRAAEHGDFHLDFQPIYSLNSGELIGAEVLLRWSDAELGDVSPDHFIPIAEETGLITIIGAWAIRSAAQQVVAWHIDGYTLPKLGINVSARQLNDERFIQSIEEIQVVLKDIPTILELELTETAIMENPGQAEYILTELRARGVHFAIDDFGTGYSSLGYLKRFPLDALKVDRSFVRDVTTDPEDVKITNAIIALAHSLGLMVIAEGVETEEQLAFLIAHGCDHVQGFMLSKPQPANSFWCVVPRCIAQLARIRGDSTPPVNSSSV